jgi:hypothetical protein
VHELVITNGTDNKRTQNVNCTSETYTKEILARGSIRPVPKFIVQTQDTWVQTLVASCEDCNELPGCVNGGKPLNLVRHQQRRMKCACTAPWSRHIASFF